MLKIYIVLRCSQNKIIPFSVCNTFLNIRFLTFRSMNEIFRISYACFRSHFRKISAIHQAVAFLAASAVSLAETTDDFTFSKIESTTHIDPAYVLPVECKDFYYVAHTVVPDLPSREGTK